QFVNAHGQRQGTCIHLGNCDIGCDVRAKNGLDVNYIPRAEQRGAEVRPLHLVRFIEPRGSQYRVVFDRVANGRLIPGEETAERVILAAGSLGTTELLLRCRDQYRTLRALSPTLGTRWSGNANFISMATYSEKDRVRQSTGPTISSILDFSDGGFRSQRFVVEDDGFPNLLLRAIKAYLDDGVRTRFGPHLPKRFEEHLREDTPVRNLLLWLGAGMDAGEGQLHLKRRWLMPWKRGLKRMQAMHQELTAATAGRFRSLPTWTLLKSLLTLPPLGGCPMGTALE